MNLEENVAVVTGAASSLGAATAHHLSALGMRVAFLDRDAGQAVELASSVGGHAIGLDGVARLPPR